MIEILIKDKVWEWVYAQMTECLEDTLYFGFPGFNSYSDAELKEAIEFLGNEQIKEIEEMIKQDEEKSRIAIPNNK